MMLPELSTAWAEAVLSASLKGLVLLLLAGVIVLALRQASAATRHAFWSMALAGLLLLPVFALILPAWRVSLLPSLSPARPVHGFAATPSAWAVAPVAPVVPVPVPEPAEAPAAPVVVLQKGTNAHVVVVPDASVAVRMQTPAALMPGREAAVVPAWLTWLLLVWGAGSVLLLARIVVAQVRVAALVRRAVPVREPEWLEQMALAMHRLGMDRPVRLLWTPEQMVPMAVGCFRPAVLIPVDAEAWTSEQREAVLLHELAHVKRWDCFFHLVGQVACALHWPNPLAWVAMAQMQAERERACDDLVLNAGTRASAYAGHLLELARTLHAPAWSAAASLAMARRSQLEGRLLAILDPSRRRHSLNRAAGFCTALVVACLVLPLAAMRPASSTPASAPDEPDFVFSFRADVSKGGEPRLAEVIDMREIEAAVEAALEASSAFSFDADFEEKLEAAIASAIERADPESLTVEMLIELRKHGVDAAYIRSLREIGYTDLTVDELIDLSRYGVSTDYMRELQVAGLDDLSVDELIDLAKYGVDPDFIGFVRSAGFANVDIDGLIDLAKYGVSRELIASLREAGYTNLTADEMADLAKYGVDGAYIRSLRDAGFTDLSTEALIDLRKYGFTPELARVLSRMGYTHSDLDVLTDLSKYGVTPEYVEAMNGAGLGRLDLADIAELGKYGIDPGYVRELREAGLTGFTVEELIDLYEHGVDAEYVRSMKQ